MAQVKTQLVIDGKNNSKKAFDEVNSQLNSMNKQLATAGKALIGVFSVSALTGSIRGISNATGAWAEMTDRIKLATKSDKEYQESLDSLRKISDRTFTSMANNAEAFISSLTPLRERGFSTREALQFTEALGLGLVASAAKGEKAASVINQFSNALQDGVLRGDAFNSMIRNPCGDGQGWVNTFDNLWLSASFTGARRWVQSVTESYKLVLSTAAGESELTRIVQRAGYTVSIERDQAESWGSDPIRGGGTGNQDLSDEVRRSNAIATALRIGQAMIVGAHRETTLSWDVPTSMAMGIDLWHTLEIADQGVHAVGKCRRIVHQFDLGSGEAITSLSIAIMRGGGVSDALAVPAQPDTSLPPFTSSAQLLLGTQLGGRQVDPYTGFPIGPYDDDRPGFSGNYDTNDNMPAEFYPRRFDINAREIGAEYRDERTASAEAFYRVGIPNDLLEL